MGFIYILIVSDDEKNIGQPQILTLVVVLFYFILTLVVVLDIF
jgi:hypothetical protein